MRALSRSALGGVGQALAAMEECSGGECATAEAMVDDQYPEFAVEVGQHRDVDGHGGAVVGGEGSVRVVLPFTHVCMLAQL